MRRTNWLTLLGFAFFVVLHLTDPAAAFIERLTPLGDLLEDSDCVFLARTELVSDEKRLAVFTTRENLKGRNPFPTLLVQLTGDKENHVPHLLKRIAPGVPVVFFVTPVDKQWLGLGYTNGTWFQILGRSADATIRWHFTHCEIYLRRTFKGSTEELVQVIREVLAGKRKPPPPNPKEPPGFGPELAKTKPTGMLPLKSRQLFAVILLPPLAGLLAPLLSLLAPGMLLLVWRQYRFLVYVLAGQSTLLLVQAGLRWWNPSAWWLSPHYWWWPILTLIALGFLAGCVSARAQQATLADVGRPLWLEWWVLLAVFIVGLGWGLISWRWYGTAFDQMTPLTLGSVAGLAHLVLRRIFDRLALARWPTGQVVLGAMLLCGMGIAWNERQQITPIVAAASPTEESWLQYRGNPERTGCTNDCPIPRRPKVLWRCDLGQGRGRFYVHSTPTVVGDYAYCGILHDIQGQTRGYLVCVNLTEHHKEGQTLPAGQLMWRFDAEGTLKPVFGSPTLRSGRLYFGEGYHQDYGCRLFCLDASNGRVLWQYATRSHVESTPTLAGELVVVGGGEEGLLALVEKAEAHSVELAWQIGHWHVDGSPLVVEGTVYCGSLEGDSPTTQVPFVGSFRLSDGRTLWRIESPLPVSASLAWADGKVLVPLGNGKINADPPTPRGGLLALDPATGNRLWLYDDCGPVFSTPAVKEKRVYFGSKDGRLRCLDTQTGKLLWCQELDSAIVSSPALGTDGVIAVSVRGCIYALDPITGQLRWRLDDLVADAPNQDVYSSPVLHRGRIYLGVGRKLVCIGEE